MDLLRAISEKMPESPEHLFIKEAIHQNVSALSASRLFGLCEVDRKRFDYGCRIDRDWRRTLVSQVLWGNEQGLEKDLRTLLHESRAPMKLYVYPNKVRIQQRIHEVIEDYSANPNTRSLLGGLIRLPLPPDFDADKRDHRRTFARTLKRHLLQDVLFQIVFRLTETELRFFLDYGGVFGLKYALLAYVHQSPVSHMLSFMDAICYKSKTVIDKCFIMLSASGLIYKRSQLYLPTAKGQMLLDVTRSVLRAMLADKEFDPELCLILNELRSKLAVEPNDSLPGPAAPCDLIDLQHVRATEQFGISLLTETRTLNEFYSLKDFLRLREAAMPPLGFDWGHYFQSAWGCQCPTSRRDEEDEPPARRGEVAAGGLHRVPPSHGYPGRLLAKGGCLCTGGGADSGVGSESSSRFCSTLSLGSFVVRWPSASDFHVRGSMVL